MVLDNVNGASAAAKAGRRRPRTRSEIEAERRDLERSTRQEISEIATEHHALLPRNKAKLIGAIYARYSTRFQGSIADQVRSMYQEAVKRGIFIPLENVFFDLAVRGGKNDRQGLNRLREMLAQRKIQVLLLFSTSRLFRKLYHALAFVDQVVKEWGIRCLFVKSGIDTDDKQRWEMLLQMHGMIDQFSVAMSGEHVRAAHEGLLDKQHVHGTLTFGFTGVLVEGQVTRRNLPRRKIAKDPETAPWVAKIFRWYGEDRLAIEAIVQRLNGHPDIPLPPKSTTGMWTYLAAHTLLQNPRYRGWWLYGEKENTWILSKDYTRQIKRPEPLRQVQIEELRIVSDELWYAVQKRLAEEQRLNAGRKPKDGNRTARPRLLNGLFFCPEHGRPLQVGGAFGHVMFCPACRALPAADRPLYSLLNRELALRLTCETLARFIRQDNGLVDEVIAACQAEAAALQQPDPSRLAELRTRADQLARKIAFNQRNVGDTPEDHEETAKLIKDLRDQRNTALAELKALEAGQARTISIPTKEETRQLLDELDQLLMAAATSNTEANAGKAREVIKLLTGGRINLYQQGERRRHGGWLQGRFQKRLLPFLANKAIGGSTTIGTAVNHPATEVVIDYRDQTMRAWEGQQAKELYDQGLMHKEIAARLGCGRNWVTKLLQGWFGAHGQPFTDGRQRRSTLPHKQMMPTMYAQLADQAKALWDQGQADVQIAARLNCSPPTVVAAVEHWHRSRGLEPPSHASRRANLVDLMQQLYVQHRSIRDIAKAVGMCTRSVTLLLRERFVQEGRTLPDGRTRGRPGSAIQA
ncbi:MAG: recombinase family protein [Planctomycetia bacterium]|nr:recombinase family protein [Planctomycetia bacterium]